MVASLSLSLERATINIGMSVFIICVLAFYRDPTVGTPRQHLTWHTAERKFLNACCGCLTTTGRDVFVLCATVIVQTLPTGERCIALSAYSHFLGVAAASEDCVRRRPRFASGKSIRCWTLKCRRKLEFLLTLVTHLSQKNISSCHQTSTMQRKQHVNFCAWSPVIGWEPITYGLYRSACNTSG